MAEGSVVSLVYGARWAGERKSKTLAEEEKVEELMALASAVGQPKTPLRVSWADDVRVMKVKLPQPVGLFTNGEIEVWGTMLRKPGINHCVFYGHGDPSADALVQFITSLV